MVHSLRVPYLPCTHPAFMLYSPRTLPTQWAAKRKGKPNAWINIYSSSGRYYTTQTNDLYTKRHTRYILNKTKSIQKTVSPPLSPRIFLLITIIHKPLLQIPTQPPLTMPIRMSMSILTIPPSFQRLPPRRIHMHPHHNLPLLIINTDIIMVVFRGMRAVLTPPARCRSKHKTPQAICNTVTQGRGVRGDSM